MNSGMSQAWVIGTSLLVASMGIVVQGSTIRHDRNQSDYLSVGNYFTSVGRVDGVGLKSDGTLFSYIASGTLIAPQWVLTAGHVVDMAQSLDFTIGGRTIPAERWVAHPNWTGNLATGYDIALFKLPVPVEGIIPATIYRGTTEQGRIGTAAGFGKTGTGLTGATIFDGQKRGSQNMLDKYYDTSKRILLTDFDNPSSYAFLDNFVGSRTPLHIEGLIAPGDSGGPVFASEGTGRVLVGVNSFVGASIFDGKADSDYGDFAGHTRVSIFAPWIDSTMNSGTFGTASLPTITGGSPANLRPAILVVPEPSGLLLLAGTCALIIGRRPR